MRHVVEPEGFKRRERPLRVDTDREKVGRWRASHQMMRQTRTGAIRKTQRARALWARHVMFGVGDAEADGSGGRLTVYWVKKTVNLNGWGRA